MIRGLFSICLVSTQVIWPAKTSVGAFAWIGLKIWVIPLSLEITPILKPIDNQDYVTMLILKQHIGHIPQLFLSRMLHIILSPTLNTLIRWYIYIKSVIRFTVHILIYALRHQFHFSDKVRCRVFSNSLKTSLLTFTALKSRGLVCEGILWSLTVSDLLRCGNPPHFSLDWHRL